MTNHLSNFELSLLTVACALDMLADAPGVNMFGPITIVPGMEVPDTEKERSRRESYLDHLHTSLEADPSPEEPVHVYLFPSDGGGTRLVIHLDSLQQRKERTPSERERRRLLGIELADFLTAGGL